MKSIEFTTVLCMIGFYRKSAKGFSSITIEDVADTEGFENDNCHREKDAYRNEELTAKDQGVTFYFSD